MIILYTFYINNFIYTTISINDNPNHNSNKQSVVYNAVVYTIIWFLFDDNKQIYIIINVFVIVMFYIYNTDRNIIFELNIIFLTFKQYNSV